MINVIAYLSFGFGSFIYFTILFFNARRSTIEQEPDTVKEDNAQTIDTNSDVLPTEGRSYKRNNLTIEIPDNDAFVNLGQAAFVISYFKENCFPLSQMFLKTGDFKMYKFLKWFLTINFQITFNLIIFNNYGLIKSSENAYIMCPMISCLFSIIFSSILSIIFKNEVNDIQKSIKHKEALVFKAFFTLFFWVLFLWCNILSNVNNI